MPALETRRARASPGLLPSRDSDPVLWRQWHRNRPSRQARIVVALYVALAATFSVVAIASALASKPAFVKAIQVSIGLLLLSVTSATTLAEKRASANHDVLLAMLGVGRRDRRKDVSRGVLFDERRDREGVASGRSDENNRRLRDR
jgi:hypothetical protein